MALAFIATAGSLLVRTRKVGGQNPESALEVRLAHPVLFRWVGRLTLGATLAGLVLASHRWSTRWPLGTADAINIWNVRARFLFFDPNAVDELFGMMKRGHPDYPLFLPASLAAQAGFRGDWDQALPQATGAAFVLGLGCMTYLGLHSLGAGHLAAFGTALVLASPPVWRWAFSQCADLPLAYLVVSAGVGLASPLETTGRRPPPALLVGGALGLLPWTKYEGLLVAGSFGGLFTLLWLVRRRETGTSGSGLLWIAAGAFPGFLALALFRIFWAPEGSAELFLGEAPAKLFDPDRWRVVLGATAATLDPFTAESLWRWIPPVFAVSIVFLRARGAAMRLPVVHLAAGLALAALSYLAVYALSPHDLV